MSDPILGFAHEKRDFVIEKIGFDRGKLGFNDPKLGVEHEKLRFSDQNKGFDYGKW